MDPSTALLLLSLSPARIDAHAAILPGTFLPVILPLDGLGVATRAAWLAQAREVPLGKRVQALLAAGRTAEAFQLVMAFDSPITGEVDLALSSWATRERERLGLPAGDGLVQSLTADGPAVLLVREAEQALATVRHALPLAWPRWSGPLILVGPDPAQDPIPGLTWLARPAVPFLRCNSPSRGDMAKDIVGLSLALSAPPARGWPAWLRLGLAEACARRSLGQPASPRDMRRDRHGAGASGLREVLGSAHPDAALSLAVCSLLLQADVRQRFSALLDLLRNDASSEGAVQVAYGWTPEELAARP